MGVLVASQCCVDGPEPTVCTGTECHGMPIAIVSRITFVGGERVLGAHRLSWSSGVRSATMGHCHEGGDDAVTQRPDGGLQDGSGSSNNEHRQATTPFPDVNTALMSALP